MTAGDRVAASGGISESWAALSRKIYWDRTVALEAWRQGIAQAKPSYLEDAVLRMKAREFVRFYGAPAFEKDWPRLRAALSPRARRARAPLYTLLWSQLRGGGFNLFPFPDIDELPRRRREFLLAVAREPGSSVYAIAKSLHMQYRRAHDHAAALIREGRIKGRPVVEQSRRKLRLYPISRH
jgi:hypothetical protein